MLYGRGGYVERCGISTVIMIVCISSARNWGILCGDSANLIETVKIK